MSDIKDIWEQIDKEFNDDASIEIDTLLKQKGIKKPKVPSSIAETADALVDFTFNQDILPKNTKLSKYNIKQQINSGGQSEIYLAERSDGIYQKTVAIKFIALRYSAETLRKQFLQEMQILADLNHPGIISIIDGGITKENQPWLVLDYIDGLHIDEYCLQQNLPPKQIINLFLNICDALHFVHQRGIVHMDIKANNILINSINNIPYPVIIDFGIANGHKKNPSNDIFGTTGISAPEQIMGKKVDQRADIYSLGILLGQLLTNDGNSNIGLLNAKERLNKLKTNKTNKNLINIVEKATQQEAENRYQNMEALRTDLNNYLFDLPLINQQNHIGHILARTFSRHKMASLLSIFVIVIAIGFWGKYTSDISNQQTLTIKAKNNSDELFNFMLTDLFSNLSDIGRVDILKLVTEKSIKHLKSQDNQFLDDNSLLQSAIAYTNAGKVFDALNSSEQALSAYNKGILALDKISDSPKFKKQHLSQLALIHNLKGLTLTAEGQQVLTEETLLKSLKTSANLLELFPNEDLELVYEAHNQLGWYYMEYEDPENAIIHINASIKTAKSMNERKLDYQWLFKLSQAYQVLAWYQFDYEDHNQAISTINKSIKLANRTIEENGDSIIYFFNKLTLVNQFNYFHLEINETDKTEKTVIEAIKIGKSLKQKAPKNIEYLRELAYAYSMAGKLNEHHQNYKTSLDYYHKSLSITEIMNQHDVNNFSNANDFANDLIYIATIHEKLDQSEKAQDLWNRVIEIMQPIHLLEPNNKYYTTTLIFALVKSGNIEQAKPLIMELKDSGFNDKEFVDLMIEYNLN